jgi:hypothetical protein
VELRFSLPSLRKLDLLGTEVILSALAEDEQPPHGLSGLLDWRMAGRISALIERGFVTGKLGEVVLLPGKPKLPFDKVLLFGIGARADSRAYAFAARWSSCRGGTSTRSVRTAPQTSCSRAPAASRCTTCGR